MKNYQLINEGTWVEILKVELTEEQKTILLSGDDKKDLLSLIKSKREGKVSIEKKNSLSAFYDSVKPELKEEDVYQLISADFSEKSENVFTGIINCRINGEHKQIRF
jgi:hypothetical protein